jgi:hypothetical protein
MDGMDKKTKMTAQFRHEWNVTLSVEVHEAMQLVKSCRELRKMNSLCKASILQISCEDFRTNMLLHLLDITMMKYCSKQKLRDHSRKSQLYTTPLSEYSILRQSPAPRPFSKQNTQILHLIPSISATSWTQPNLTNANVTPEQLTNINEL